MLRELTLQGNVSIPTKDVDNNTGLIHQRSLLATHLLKLLLRLKSSSKHGYFLSVTRLLCTGKVFRGTVDTVFPVIFTCRTFLPCVGETMLGTVRRIRDCGVLMSYGPIRLIFLAFRQMGEFHNFVPGEKPAFLNDSFSRIEVGVVVRFKVFGVRYIEEDFHVLATLEGDSLGPVSLCSDEMDVW